MPTLHQKAPAHRLPQIECGGCKQKLPIRLTVNDEPAAVWLCATCNIPFVACCVEELLQNSGELIRFDERFFDVSEHPPISRTERRRSYQLASRPHGPGVKNQRRSERSPESLVVPAVELDHELVPTGEPFQIMVSNLSREGVGLIHDSQIDVDHIAIKLSIDNQEPIQVVVKIVRQRELTPPYYELGGLFKYRLGSVAIH